MIGSEFSGHFKTKFQLHHPPKYATTVVGIAWPADLAGRV